MQDSRSIWMYWEGERMPEFVRWSIATVQHHRGSLSLNLLDQDSVRDYLPELGPDWRKLQKPAHRADYVRTRLVHRYGGLWLDADMAVLSPLAPLLDIPPGYDYACQSMASSIGCFAARPGCRLLAAVCAAQDEVLRERGRDCSWNAIGNDLLERLGRDYPYHRWPEWTVDEIAGGKVSTLLSKSAKFEDHVDRHAVVFHFCGNLTGPLLDTYAKHQHRRLLHSRMLLAKILRRALSLDEPSPWDWRRHGSEWCDGLAAVRRRLRR